MRIGMLVSIVLLTACSGSSSPDTQKKGAVWPTDEEVFAASEAREHFLARPCGGGAKELLLQDPNCEEAGSYGDTSGSGDPHYRTVEVANPEPVSTASGTRLEKGEKCEIPSSWMLTCLASDVDLDLLRVETFTNQPDPSGEIICPKGTLFSQGRDNTMAMREYTEHVRAQEAAEADILNRQEALVRRVTNN